MCLLPRRRRSSVIIIRVLGSCSLGPMLLEHCNINDTEIESSREVPLKGERAKAYRAIYRPVLPLDHRLKREKDRDVRPLGNIHFRGRLESSLPSRIICNLFFRGPHRAPHRVCVHRWHRNRCRGRCQSPLWDNVNRSERKIVFTLLIRRNSFCLRFTHFFRRTTSSLLLLF